MDFLLPGKVTRLLPFVNIEINLPNAENDIAVNKRTPITANPKQMWLE